MKLMLLLGLLCFTLGANQESTPELIDQCNIFINPDKFSSDVDVAEFHDDLAFAFYYQLSASDINVPQLHVAKMLSMYLPELSEFCENFNVRKITLSPNNPYNLVLNFHDTVQKEQVLTELSEIKYIQTIQLPEKTSRQAIMIASLSACAAVGIYQLIKAKAIPFIS